MNERDKLIKNGLKPEEADHLLFMCDLEEMGLTNKELPLKYKLLNLFGFSFGLR